MPWTPLLSGRQAETARQAVIDLAELLSSDDGSEARHPSLADGAAGIAVFLHYVAQADLWSPGARAATKVLQRAVATANARGLGPELYLGLLGTAWAVAHTQPSSIVAGVTSVIDAGLGDFLERPPQEIHFDLIGGLVGHGVYALERPSDPISRDLVAKVVQRLAERARRLDGGLAWASESAARGNPTGDHLNLGVAHGTPGVIAFLASCHQADIERQQSRELLEGAVPWVLAHRREDGVLPYWSERGREAAPARLAWCYGDPGVALALLRAARALGREDWAQAALQQADLAARRAEERSGVVDCSLCHGAMGLGHLFGRLFAATGEQRYAEAARRWLAWGLERRVAGRGSAGFLTVEHDRSGQPVERYVPGILTGAAGIGLVLAAAVSDRKPSWDRVLLMSDP